MVFLNANAQGNTLSLFIPMIAFLAIFYFLAIRPQRKREKEINDMRNSLRVGDKIVTIGGIHGKIVKIKDEIITIEVGADRTKMDVAKWAIGTVTNRDVKADNKDNKSDKKKDKTKDEGAEEAEKPEKQDENIEKPLDNNEEE